MQIVELIDRDRDPFFYENISPYSKAHISHYTLRSCTANVVQEMELLVQITQKRLK